ncbi:MAG: CotH kinase family protein [Pseudomonadota bacterium]|nr:CotH kinase family protein [Pseudomonadota bacterium]
MLLLLLACVAPDPPGSSGRAAGPPEEEREELGAAPADASLDDPDALWVAEELPVFSLTFADADWETALSSLIVADSCGDRGYLEADLLFTNPLTGREEVWRRVGVRYRGHSALLTGNQQAGNRWGFKLSFEALGDRTFHGAEHLSLLGTEGDTSLLRERVSLDWMRAAGVPAPRANHAKLVVNGEPLGVFPLVEEADDRAFLRAHFGRDDGHLYKVAGYCDGTNLEYAGVDVSAYAGFEPKGTTTVADLATDIVPLLSCVQTGLDDEQLRACVEQWIDVDEWLSEMAADMLLTNVDGMAATAQNFLLHRPLDGRLVVYPYDLDLSFYQREVDLVGTTIFDLRPSWEPLLPVLPRRLREAYAPEFCDRVLALTEDPGAAALEAHISALAAQIDSAMQDDPFLSHEAWQVQVQNVLDEVEHRHDVVAEEARRCEIPPLPEPNPPTE